MVAATAFIVVAVFEGFWAAGGSLGLSAAWGGVHDHLPLGLRIASAFAALLLVTGAIIVLGWRDSGRPPIGSESIVGEHKQDGLKIEIRPWGGEEGCGAGEGGWGGLGDWWWIRRLDPTYAR